MQTKFKVGQQVIFETEEEAGYEACVCCGHESMMYKSVEIEATIKSITINENRFTPEKQNVVYWLDCVGYGVSENSLKEK